MLISHPPHDFSANSQPVTPGLDALRAAANGAANGDASDAALGILSFLQGKRIGLLLNPTGRTMDGTSAFEVLRSLSLEVRALFSPEHGPNAILEGTVASATTPDGLPIHSLYGQTRRPTAEMLAGLDAFVCDLQDVGARFYTYATTLAYVLEECAAHHISVIVLDRPNPLGGDIIEGPGLDTECRSFIGYLPVPIRHGLTLGELALLHQKEAALDVDLRVVPVANWNRSMLWPDTGLLWRRPSPNLPDWEAAAWYPGTCLLEFSHLSVGRGTDAPFQIIGAPWLDPARLLADRETWPLPARAGMSAEHIDFTPRRATYEGQACRGLRFERSHSKNQGPSSPLRPVALGLALLASLHRTHPDTFDATQLEASLPLLGSRAALEHLHAGDITAALALAEAAEDEFRARRAPVLLYD